MNQKQSKGTGKLVGGIFAALGAALNALIAFIFGASAMIASKDPSIVDFSVYGSQYDGMSAEELVQVGIKACYGIAGVTFVIFVALLILAISLFRGYAKQSKAAAQAQPQMQAYGAAGYAQPQFQAQPQYQNPQAQPQFQNPQFQNTNAAANNQFAGGQFSAGTTNNNTTQNQ